MYKRLQPHLKKISFVTYGDSRELDYKDQMLGIDILYNKWGLPANKYTKLVSILHLPTFLKADILKTNQTSGAIAALPVQKWYRKKLIVRCGFMWSLNTARAYGEEAKETHKVTLLEKKAFQESAHIVVTTSAMKSYASEKHDVSPGKITIIPNYVNTQLFSPDGRNERDSKTICFVGRLAKEKNLESLFDAVRNMNVRLLIVGDGPLRAELEAKSSQVKAEVTFLGTLRQKEIAACLRRSAVFLLPSIWEGQPKALLEAMACGTAVIGSDSPGIRELISHGDNGYLCGTSPSSIAEAIQTVLSDSALRNRLAANSVEYVEQNFSLERSVELELELYRSMVNQP